MLVVMVALLVSACGSASRPKQLIVQVRGSSLNLPVSESCFLLIRTPIVGGGVQTYCMERFINDPGPNVTVLSSGTMRFSLPEQTIRARVRIRTKFGPDGHHAIQHLQGDVVGGGTVTGGGPYIEQPPGHVADSNFRYRIVLP